MQEFIDFMSDVGCPLASHEVIKDDDTFHYYDVEGDKKGSRKASYILKVEADGFAVGCVYDHRLGETHSWYTKAKRGISQDERDAHKKRLAEHKKKQEEKRQKEADQAAKDALDIWNNADKSGSTPYLDRKRIGLNGARIYQGNVVVPMFRDGKRVGLQTISDSWKLFTKGAIKKDSYYAIPGDADKSKLRICEGFATGAAIKDAFPDDWVIIAWDAGNLKGVVKRFARDYPDAQIYICADNDQWRTKPGSDILENLGLIKAQQAAVAIGGCPVYAPPFPDDDPDKRTDWWDYWDAYGADGVRDAMVEIVKPRPAETPFDEIGPDDVTDDTPDHIKQIRPLGISEEGGYMFFPRGSGRIVTISASGMGRLTNLFQLVPNKNFWELHYDVDGKSSSSTIAENAAAHLINECNKLGVFRSDDKRGVGAWEDECGYIVNTGKRIIGSDIDCQPSEFESEMVYESGVNVIDMSVDSLSEDDAALMLDVCQSFTWKRPEYAKLWAGWMVVAGIGGALDWRPHIWITGRSGSGKSTAMDLVVKRMLHDIAVKHDGGTSEAGVRKYLGSSSRPFVMDEAESESMKDRANMDAILSLFRKASSGGVVANANATFQARSCACFAAINPNVTEVADAARITLLELEPNNSANRSQEFKELLAKIHKLTSKGCDKRLFKMAFENIETIIANIGAFNVAAMGMFGNQRAADQIAPLIAGAYFLECRELVDVNKATEILSRDNWDWFLSVSDENDSAKLVSHIMTSRISYDSLGARREGAIGDLIDIVVNGSEGAGDVHRGLKAYGLKVEGDYLLVANSSNNLARLLRDTPWNPWSRTLGDVAGATNWENAPVYFMRGMTKKVKAIPLGVIGDVVVEEEIPIEDYSGDFE